MARWKVCPECGSENVHCDIGATSRSRFSEDSNAIWINKIGLRANVDVFVCTDCGCIRSYISSQEALKRIRQGWPRADTVVIEGYGDVSHRTNDERNR